MCVMHQIIAGLSSKAEQLTVCLSNLFDRHTNVDVLCITEHNLTAECKDTIDIENYEMAACFMRDQKRGGACILVKKGHMFKVLEEITNQSTCGLFECCAIELSKHKLIIICVYRVPKSRKKYLYVFFDKLLLVLHIASKKTRHSIILCGDFNINTLINNNVTRELLNCLKCYNLQLQVKQATRMASGTCIDNVAHNMSTSCETNVIELALSDHMAQLLKIPTKNTDTLKFWRVEKRDYSNENLKKFRYCMEKISFHDMRFTNNPNDAFNLFHSTFKLYYDLCFPINTITIKTIKRPTWITPGIKKCSKIKRKLLWLSRSKPSLENKKRLKTYSVRFKAITKASQRLHNMNAIRNSDNRTKMAWRIINKTKLNRPKEYLQKIKVNNSDISDPKLIANAFNDYFINKTSSITQNVESKNCHIISRSTSMFMSPCTPADVFKIIKGLKNKRSVGYDGVSTKVIKYVADCLAPHLSYLINLSISEGVFPDMLKTGIIKPIHKKDDKEDMKSYRPVALLSVFAKVFEKFIHMQLYNYFEKMNLLTVEQQGFREQRSTTMAIFDLLSTVTRNVDKRRPVCSVFMDMTQAFDFVDHNILLKKLDSYGVRGNVIKLLESYLSNRRQYVEISRLDPITKKETAFLSESRTIKYGVPQGSVLGPLLFIIYINDLSKIVDHQMTLFADDSTVIVECKDRLTYENDINDAINKIITWLTNNNLKANLTKTKLMHYGQRKFNIPQVSISYQGSPLEEVDSIKFLGVHIDQSLNWKKHVEVTCSKLAKSAYALHKLRQTVNVETVLLAYHALVASKLRYGVIFWGNSTDRDSIFKSQKRCIRAMFGLKPLDSCKSFFINYKILTFPSIYIYEVAVFIHSNPDLFQRKTAANSKLRARDISKLENQLSNTALLRKSIFGIAPKIYNRIPKEIRDSAITRFKRELMNLLIGKGYYNINDFLNDCDF